MIRARQLLIGLASGSALYSGLAPALGLGEITLHSALNQSLDAEIELLELGDLADVDFKVRLASAEVFSRSGVDRVYFLNDLRFTPLLSGGRGVIRVLSNKPVREPYLNFIVEVTRPNGNLFREYTLLLDPPGSSAYHAVASPVATAAPVVERVQVQRSSPAAPRAQRPKPSAVQGERYQVVSGDSLWKIAARLREQGSQASQQALMADIHVLNPQAFSNGDINRLLAGADLLLPDTAIGTPASVAADPAAVAIPAAQVAAVETPVESVAAEQTQVEQELAAQGAETLQLQQNLAELQVQIQQLQEQMSARDRVISGLQAELAARQANAASVPAAADVVATAEGRGANSATGAESMAPRDWLTTGLATLALLLAGLVGVLWRGRNRGQPAVSQHQPPAPVKLKAAIPPAPVPRRSESTVAAVAPSYSGDALHSAETYIAYGRFNEAVACLDKALLAQPTRSDIRWRLLEVLAQQGDVGRFLEQEAALRNAGFTAARIDELKARFAHLFAAPPADLLADAVLALDETPPVADDFKLNLDELSLDADWESMDPFASPAKKKAPAPNADKDLQDSAALPDTRDARNPFADAMLVEEAPIDSWLGEELDPAFVEQTRTTRKASSGNLDHLAGNRNNLAKLNMALAYIEQGDLDSACHILNELIHDGDDKLKKEARELLAKIA
nr:FimV/HubP family polar landmark protein [uncultured Pseudomonas sp.]